MGVNESLDHAHLASAFADFEDASNKLASFYRNLESQVSRLNEELSDARAAELKVLREKEIVANRLGSLLTALPAGVVVLDGAGCVSEFNPAATELLGDLNSGERWIDIVERTFEPQWDDGHDISLRDGRRVNIATQSLIGEPGQILLIKDVTETRRLQELLIHHRRLSAKTEIAAALAHQIRTPIASALLQTSIIAAASCNETQHVQAAVRARDAMRHLEKIVDDMLTFARGGKIDSKEFDLCELLHRLARSCGGQPDDFEIAIDVALPTLRLLGNAEALESVMQNLINNARFATNGKGRLTMSLDVGAAYVSVRFEDNGPGVPSADRSHIFEPFFTTSTTGTGLGLAVASSIVRAHGGELSLDPDYRDGARFVLMLPLPRTHDTHVATSGAEEGLRPNHESELID